MATVTLNEVGAVLKKDILPAISDAVKQEALIYQIQRKSNPKPNLSITNFMFLLS